jgi:hypothetical protein
MKTTYTAHADPAESRRRTNTRRHTAAGAYVHCLIGRIGSRRFIRGNLLASILIAAVTPIIQGDPVVMRSAAGRE